MPRTIRLIRLKARLWRERWSRRIYRWQALLGAFLGAIIGFAALTAATVGSNYLQRRDERSREVNRCDALVASVSIEIRLMKIALLGNSEKLPKSRRTFSIILFPFDDILRAQEKDFGLLDSQALRSLLTTEYSYKYLRDLLSSALQPDELGEAFSLNDPNMIEVVRDAASTVSKQIDETEAIFRTSNRCRRLAATDPLPPESRAQTLARSAFRPRVG